MRILDGRGRLWGRVSLLDLLVTGFLLALIVPPLLFAYNVSGLKEIEIRSVTPTRLVVGQDRRIRIRGSGFQPDCRVKLSTVDLGRPALVTSDSLEADVPADLPAGWYHPIVVGPRKSGVAILPLLAVWKPEIRSVSPAIFAAAEEVTLEISGARFQEDPALFLGEARLARVEYVNESLLRAKVPRGLLPPGTVRLKVVNARAGEEALSDDLIHILGRKTVSLAVVIQLESVRPRAASLLRRISSGEVPIENADVEYVQLLTSDSPETNLTRKEEISFSRNRLQVNAGLVGTVEYRDGEFLFSYRGRPLRHGEPVEFRINGNAFQGRVLGRPIVREPRYAVSSR